MTFSEASETGPFPRDNPQRRPLEREAAYLLRQLSRAPEASCHLSACEQERHG